MAKSKWPQVADSLVMIEKWARDGLTEKQMCKNLKVGTTSFNEYKKQHPELLEALKKGNGPFIAEVENALVKRALGYEYVETKTYMKSEEGKEVKYVEKTNKYQAPDVAACFIILKNKDKTFDGKSNWSNDPAKLDLEKQTLELRKKVEELKLF